MLTGDTYSKNLPGSAASRGLRVLRNVLLLAAAGTVFFLVFSATGHGIPCVIRLITGFDCPGCGMTRAVAAILRGDFSAAFSYNALSVTLLPLMLIYFAFRTIVYIRKGEEFRFALWEYVFLSASLAVCVIYWVARNLP